MRSKYFRFYRLHPRFASIFFSKFLPRFVEPSLKAFEFLIRPILLKPFDLRLPFTVRKGVRLSLLMRSEEHTSELQSLMRISYAVFCLKKKKNKSKLTLN